MSSWSYVKLASTFVLLTASIVWSYTVVVTRRMGLAQMEVNRMTIEEAKAKLDAVLQDYNRGLITNDEKQGDIFEILYAILYPAG